MVQPPLPETIMSIFALKTDADNPIQNLRESIALVTDDDGKPVAVSFSLNKGKGTGTQTVSLDDFDAFISVIQDFHDNGATEETAPVDKPASQVARETGAFKDGNLVFRTKDGKGSKPVRIPEALVSEVLSVLNQASNELKNLV